METLMGIVVIGGWKGWYRLVLSKDVVLYVM